MIFKLVHYLYFFFLTFQILHLSAANPVNLTSFLPDNQFQEDEFFVPCTGRNCLPPAGQKPLKIPGFPIIQNYRYPPLPYPQNPLLPSLCYTDKDCVGFSANSEVICKRRPGNLLPSICDCKYGHRISLNSGGRGVHTCVKDYCSKHTDCQYSESRTAWLLKLLGKQSGMSCIFGTIYGSNSYYCRCSTKLVDGECM